MTRARFLPVGLDVRERRCVVVGGGAVGTRKALSLERAGAQVVVVSPEITEAMGTAVSDGRVEWIQGPFRSEHLEDVFLVVAATDDGVVNGAVAELASRRGVLACDASSAERSQVVFGASYQGEEATVGVYTDGHDPARARRTRDRIATLLEADAPRHAGDGAADRDTGRRRPGSTLVLVVHGSRDARWRASVEGVLASLQERVGPERVRLAYMDFTPPTLLDVASTVARAGDGRSLRVLPIFLAPEGHVERDIVPLVREVGEAWPSLDVELLPPLGQLPEFGDAVVRLVGRIAQHNGSDPEVSTP